MHSAPGGAIHTRGLSGCKGHCPYWCRPRKCSASGENLPWDPSNGPHRAALLLTTGSVLPALTCAEPPRLVHPSESWMSVPRLQAVLLRLEEVIASGTAQTLRDAAPVPTAPELGMPKPLSQCTAPLQQFEPPVQGAVTGRWNASTVRHRHADDPRRRGPLTPVATQLIAH